MRSNIHERQTNVSSANCNTSAIAIRTNETKERQLLGPAFIANAWNVARAKSRTINRKSAIRNHFPISIICNSRRAASTLFTVNSPVTASKPTCTVCSKFVGYEIFGFASDAGFTVDPFDFVFDDFFLRSASSGSVEWNYLNHNIKYEKKKTYD